MKKFLASALLGLTVVSAQAATYYFSDCQAGKDTGCAVGNDSNPGTSPSAPKRSLPSSALFESLVAGDQVLLARNGSWTPAGTAFWTGNNKGTAANHIVIADYTPAGYSGSAKPLITLTAPDAGCLVITTSGMTPVHKEGFTFKNIKCVGSGIAGSGVFTYNDVSDVLLENLDISGFSIGVYPTGGNVAGVTTKRLTLRNSVIHDNGEHGFLGGGPNLLIEGNTFDNNGFQFNNPLFRNHNIYLASPSLQNAVVRGNTLTRSAVCSAKTNTPCGTIGQCQGSSIVAHDMASHLVIENNVIDETTGATGGCYGIQIAPGNPEAESYADSIVRGNRIINVGSNAISLGACPYCVVEDNVVVWSTVPAYTVQGIAIPDGNVQPGVDAVDTNLVVRNNSIYINGNNAYHRGIILKNTGSGHRVFNNLIFFTSNTSAAAQCFDTTGLTAASFAVFDYNLCYSDRPDHVVAYSSAYSTLAVARANGFDLHGQNANPLITAPTPNNAYSMALASGLSPARNAGHPTLSKKLGYHGAKNADPSGFIGAYPYNPTVTAPSSPQPY